MIQTAAPQRPDQALDVDLRMVKDERGPSEDFRARSPTVSADRWQILSQKSPGRPTGAPPGAGIRPTRQGAIGAPIPPASAQRRRNGSSVTRRNRIRGRDPLVTSVTRPWS